MGSKNFLQFFTKNGNNKYDSTIEKENRKKPHIDSSSMGKIFLGIVYADPIKKAESDGIRIRNSATHLLLQKCAN